MGLWGYSSPSDMHNKAAHFLYFHLKSRSDSYLDSVDFWNKVAEAVSLCAGLSENIREFSEKFSNHINICCIIPYYADIGEPIALIDSEPTLYKMDKLYSFPMELFFQDGDGILKLLKNESRVILFILQEKYQKEKFKSKISK